MGNLKNSENRFKKRQGRFSSLITAGKNDEDNNITNEDEVISQKIENNITNNIEEIASDNISESKSLSNTSIKKNNIEEVNMTEKNKEEAPSIELKDNQIDIITETKESEVEKSNNGLIFISAQEQDVKKKYANFYLKETTLNKITKYAGKGKGKTGMNKSELVDYLLEQAFKMLKVK